MRFLTVSLDKHAVAWAERRRKIKTKSKLIMSIEQSAKGKRRRYQISYSFKY